MSKLSQAVKAALLPFCEKQTATLRGRFNTEDVTDRAREIADTMRANGQAAQFWEVMAVVTKDKDLAGACRVMNNGTRPILPAGAIAVITKDVGGHGQKPGTVIMLLETSKQSQWLLDNPRQDNQPYSGIYINSSEGQPELRPATEAEVKSYVEAMNPAQVRVFMTTLSRLEPFKQVLMAE